MIAKGEFTDPALKPDAPAPPVPVCRLVVTEVVDGRRVTDTLGVGIKSPPDTRAWLRSVVAGFGARGFTVSFAEAPPPPEAGQITARVTFVNGWVSFISTNKLASVVMRVSVVNDKGQVLDKYFRGDHAVLNWAGTTGEIQNMIDYTLGKTLDAMAPDLATACGAVLPSPPPPATAKGRKTG